MIRVNMWHIGNFLGQLTGLDQTNYARVAALSDDNKPAFRETFAAYLSPVWRRLSPSGQQMLRESLRYFLNTRPKSLADTMLSAMQDVPIGSEDPYPMLEALWEVLFPAEEYALTDLRNYVECNDAATGNEIYAPDGGWPTRNTRTGGGF